MTKISKGAIVAVQQEAATALTTHGETTRGSRDNNAKDKRTNARRQRPRERQQQVRMLTIRRRHIINARNSYQLLRDNKNEDRR